MFYSFYIAAMACFNIVCSTSICGQTSESRNLTSRFPDQSVVCSYDTLSQEELLTLLTSKTLKSQSHDLDLHSASEVLEIFVAALKSFVQETCYNANVRLKTCQKNFESAEFAFHERFLGSTFLTLLDAFKPSLAKDSLIARKIEFSSYMFQAMRESSRMLQFYTLSTNPARRLVHRMIQLNVQLLTLYDSTGMPDRNRKRYEKDLMQFSRELNFWTRSFATLNDVLPRTRVVFRSQMSKAETTIQALSSKPGKISGGQPSIRESPTPHDRPAC